MIRARYILGNLSPQGPYTGLHVELMDLAGEVGRQSSLFVDIRARDQLAEIVKQLQSKYNGPVPIYQYREVEPWSRIPERRGAMVRYVP